MIFYKEKLIQSAKLIGTGLATTGLIGAGVDIGVVFGALIIGLSQYNRNYLEQIIINNPNTFPYIRLVGLKGTGNSLKHLNVTGHLEKTKNAK